MLAAPRASIGKKAPAGRPGQSVETVYTLAASALFALHADAVNWPVELLKYYVLDALGPRHWVDNPDLSLFTENLLQWSKLGSSVGTVTAEPAADDAPAEEEEETLAGGGGDIETVALKDNSACLGGAVKNRFSLCMAEAREVVWSALLNRVDTNYHITVDAGSGTHAVILTLAAFSGMPEVRTMAAGCLPRLLGLISAEEEVRGLLMAVADGLSLSCRQPVTDAASTYFKVFTLIPSDVSVIFQLVKLRLMLKASRSQQDMYRAMLCKLAECSAVIGRIVVQVLIEDDILLSGTAPSRADTIKLLMKIFEVLDSHNLASNLKDSVENNHKLNSPSSKLFGLAVHDILSSRLRIESRSSASVSSTAWDYNRDSILADVIVKVLQLMSIRKIKLLDFLKSVLVDPLSVCKALSQSAGHMPNVDMVTSVRQNSFVCLLAQGTHDTAPRRKAVSDVLWFYSELSKMLQVDFFTFPIACCFLSLLFIKVLLCHEICIIDGILRKKDQVDGTTDGGSTGASRPSLGRGVAAPGPIGSGGRVGSWAKPGGVGLTLSAGRSGLTLGRGRGGIPAGLTLNRSGSKPSRPFPISALTRPGASPDARLESPRERSGSMDSTDGDTGQVDLELMPTHLQESRRQLLLEILSLQEASLEWLHQTLSLVSNPSVMCCSLLPTNSNTGRPSGGISATNSHTGTIDSTATSDFISGVAVSKDGAPMIPTGDSPCIFTTTIGGVPTLTEFKDDHIRLWLSWIKACLCINLNQNFNRVGNYTTISVLWLFDLLFFCTDIRLH